MLSQCESSTVGLDDPTTDDLVRQVALDSIPTLRRQVVDTLSADRAEATTRTLGETIGLPTSVVGRVCEDLDALGVLQRRSDVNDHERRWSLSSRARNLMDTAGLQPSQASP